MSVSGWSTTARLITPPASRIGQAASRPTAVRQSPALAAQFDAITARENAAHPLALPAVYAAVRLISSSIQQLRVTAPGDPQWLRRPRSYGAALDLSDLVQYLVVSMALRGTGYLRCVRIAESWRLDVVDPQYVARIAAPGPIVSHSWTLAGQEIPALPDAPADAVQRQPYLLHVPYLVTIEHPEGTSPISECRTALDGYADSETAAGRLLAGGTVTGGLLTSDQQLTPEQALRYQETWAANRATGRIPVLGAGLSYENVTLSPRDAQFIESRQFSMQQIMSLYGIPPDMLGLTHIGGGSSMTYANARDNRVRFRQNCLEAFTVQLEDSLSLLLPPGRNSAEDQRISFDYEEWEAAGAQDVDAGSEPTGQ